MRMRSLKVSGACSTTEEPAGIPQSQSTPGPSGVRNDLRGEVSGPQQEDGFEEVVILQGDDEVSLEDEEKKDEDKKEIEKKRRSAALGLPSLRSWRWSWRSRGRRDSFRYIR